ncbi:hypothetical protein ABZS29_18135 [Kribbella sp. NPDC005582]|uniref:hypothetical protein n=1 Tax=Kribbella sp. NPDC005582 TaxID=3156893 RepID=UPI0033B238C6
MRIEFDTDNAEDVAKVRALLGLTADAPAANGDTPDYETYVLGHGNEPSRRPHMVSFIKQTKAKYGYTSHVQEKSDRVTLRIGSTPMIYVYTSGRTLFRIQDGRKIPAAAESCISPTSESDKELGWAYTVYLLTEDHLRAALALAEITRTDAVGS